MARVLSPLFAAALVCSTQVKAADFFTHFPTKTQFSQSTVINKVLAEAHKKADLAKSTKGGVCALVTLEWVVLSHDNGGADKGFSKMVAEDVNTSKGLAFWTQILGAYKTYAENPDGILDGGSTGRRSEVLELLSRNKLKATHKGSGATASAVKALLKSGSYSYLSLTLPQGGHAIGCYADASGIKLMDPNGGLTASGSADTLLADMITTYGATAVHVYTIEDK